MKYEEIPPGTAIIEAIQAERSPFHSWAGEALDNSLDAQATEINLTMSDVLAAEDNGKGITIDRDNASVQIAQHGEMEGTRLGRFGVGIKYKSIAHGNIMEIISTSKDGRLRRSVNWDTIRKQGRWLYPAPARIGVVSGTPTGTKIIIKDLRRQPKAADIDKTRTEIQRRYYPALEHGKRIVLNGDLVLPLVRPDLNKLVDTTLNFPGGRIARVRAGMLADPNTARLRQVDLCVAYRIIKPECAFGCDGYGGIRAMYALIELNAPWKLSKFKDDIADDPYEEKLEAEVEKVLRPILELCQSASMFLKTKKLEELVNEQIPPERRASRPQQKQKLGREGDKRGQTVAREIPNSDDALSGPTNRKKPPRGILIEFADSLSEQHGYGRAIVGKSETRIQLAKDNPHIAQLIESRDMGNSAIGLYAIATLILHGELQIAQPSFFDEPFGLRAWKLARQQNLPTAAE